MWKWNVSDQFVKNNLPDVLITWTYSYNNNFQVLVILKLKICLCTSCRIKSYTTKNPYWCPNVLFSLCWHLVLGAIISKILFDFSKFIPQSSLKCDFCQDKDCIQKIISMLTSKSKSVSPQDGQKIEELFSNPNETVGLLINERFINIPYQITLPAMQSLRYTCSL